MYTSTNKMTMDVCIIVSSRCGQPGMLGLLW